jgi:hypothetical protein
VNQSKKWIKSNPFTKVPHPGVIKKKEKEIATPGDKSMR